MESSNVLRQTEEFTVGSYVKLRTCNVPRGWTNHPAYLGVNVYFSDETDNVKATLKADHNIPDARPIITNCEGLPRVYSTIWCLCYKTNKLKKKRNRRRGARPVYIG